MSTGLGSPEASRRRSRQATTMLRRFQPLMKALQHAMEQLEQVHGYCRERATKTVLSVMLSRTCWDELPSDRKIYETAKKHGVTLEQALRILLVMDAWEQLENNGQGEHRDIMSIFIKRLDEASWGEQDLSIHVPTLEESSDVTNVILPPPDNGNAPAIRALPLTVMAPKSSSMPHVKHVAVSKVPPSLSQPRKRSSAMEWNSTDSNTKIGNATLSTNATTTGTLISSTKANLDKVVTNEKAMGMAASSTTICVNNNGPSSTPLRNNPRKNHPATLRKRGRSDDTVTMNTSDTNHGVPTTTCTTTIAGSTATGITTTSAAASMSTNNTHNGSVTIATKRARMLPP